MVRGYISLQLTLLLGWTLLPHPALAAPNPYLTRLEARRAQLERLRTQPGGVVALHGLLEELWDWVPPGDIERLLARARETDSHPLVRSFATLVAAGVARALGRDRSAAGLRRLAGVVPRWLVCGPLPGQGLEGHEHEHAVEHDLGVWPFPRRRYPGQPPVRWVSWRPLPVEPRDAGLGLSSLVGQGVAYLATLVRSDREQPAALRLGTAGPFKVFLNGRVTAQRAVTRRPAPDQDVVAVTLRRGESWIVLKLSSVQGGGQVFARLTAADGDQLSGVSFPALAGGVTADTGGPVGAPRPVVDPERWLRARAEVEGGALGDYVDYLVRATPMDRTDRALEAVLDRWVAQEGTAEAHLLRARLRQDGDGERRDVERALEVEPSDPWALVRLARLESTARRHLRAARLLARVLALDQTFLPAELERVDAFRMAGLDAMASAALDRTLVRHPDLGGVVLERANLALAHDDVARAERLFRRYLRTNRADVSTHRALADLALRRGDPRSAREQLEAAVRVAPHLQFLRLELAALLEGGGALEPALAQYRAATTLDPHASRPLEKMGHALFRAGRVEQAWTAWRRALRLQPQNTELRRYLTMLGPKVRLGLAERYRQETAPMLAAARRQVDGRFPARVLLESAVTEIHESGLSRTLRQRVVQVTSEAGVRLASSHVIAYNPDRQTVDVRVARVRRASGAVSQGRQGERDINEPWAGLWYDLRALEIRFSGLRPGDIVELEYLVEDVAESNLFADYFGDLVYLQQQLPVDRFSYTVLASRARPLHVRGPRTPGVEHRVLGDGRVSGHQWTARALKRVAPEPSMPGWSEVADYVHVSTYGSWEEVGRWYWGLIRPQLEATGPIARAATRLTAGCRTDEERIRAIHNFVAKNTRYVGLQFGVHSYKPYPADQVLARRFGDCKDKATLMIALLGQVGIPAEMVLVRTRRRGAMDREPASLAPFDHAIVYIPKQGLYLDATAEFAGTGELPFQDQGVMALHVGTTGAVRLTRTPLFSASANTLRVEEELTIAPDGAVRLVERRRVAGQAAPRWRSHYQSADTRRQRYERTWSGWFGGAAVHEVQMPHLDDLERPVEVRAVVGLDGLVRREGGTRMTLPPGSGPEASLVQAYGRLTRREQPLELGYPWRSVQRSRLIPPGGWRFARAPDETRVVSPFGGFERRVALEGRVLVVTQEVRLERARVSPAEYPAFRRFLERLDRLLGERVVLDRTR